MFDPKLDLKLERVVDVPRELVWMAWTDPVHILKWFTPAPWKTIACEIDLRPGGRFHTVMQSPEGETFPGDGCYLEVVPNERLVWTSALLPGFRPVKEKPEDLLFTGMITLEAHGEGTKYTATVFHADEGARQRHEDMGFYHGWGAALDQLVASVKALG